MAPIRIPFALASGLLLALAGFFGLVQLIGAPLDVEKAVVVDRFNFTRQIVDTPIIEERPNKPEREPPKMHPEVPRIGPGGGEHTVATFRPPLTRVVTPGRARGLPMGVDREAIPLVRIDPTYPRREQERGIEGWVLVQFTVTAIGTVRDAIVVESEPKSVFDAAALEAIGRWRYNPRVDGGVAVDRVGLRTVIRFKLEGSESGV
ncbi:MAG TPA: energy transducer TonB [Gammaproteobacteria bacterium]